MKKYICILMTIICLTCYVTQTIIAEDDTVKVIYNVEDETFRFENTSDYVEGEQIYPDLFTSMKELLPGDTIEQEIMITIEGNKEYKTVKLYAQAKENNGEYEFLLKQTSINIFYNNKDITQQMNEPILLGSFTSNESTTITLKLQIPVSVGNEIEDLFATTQWVFSAEVIDDEVDTSDHSITSMYICGLICAFIGYKIYKRVKK